jgi:hypothetical protein
VRLDKRDQKYRSDNTSLQYLTKYVCSGVNGACCGKILWIWALLPTPTRSAVQRSQKGKVTFRQICFGTRSESGYREISCVQNCFGRALPIGVSPCATRARGDAGPCRAGMEIPLECTASTACFNFSKGERALGQNMATSNGNVVKLKLAHRVAGAHA